MCRSVIILAAVLICSPPSLSRAWSPWSLYDRTSGLAGNTVRVIEHGPGGSLWIGTKGGLSRFDGASWENLGRADGLPGDDVHTVFFDGEGGTWIGTGSGFGIYRNGAWSRLGLPGAAKKERVAVARDGEGTIWFGHGGGLMRYVPGEGELSFVPELEGISVTSLLFDGSGRLWAGTKSGLRHLDRGSWEALGKEDGIPPGAVTSLLEDGSGTVWCGTTEGLAYNDGPGWSPADDGEDLPNRHVTSLAEDRQGRLWVGTMGGLGWYDGYEWIWLGDGDGIPSREVLALTADRNGSIWVGTSRGLARYDSSWTLLEGYEDEAPSLRAPLAAGADGTVYLASEKGFYEGAGRFGEYVGPREGIDARPAVFAFDGEGLLWIGTDNGLFSYDEGSIDHFSPPEYVREIVEKEYGHVGVDVRHYDRFDGLKGEVVTALQSMDDVLWVGTTAGLSAFDGTAWDLVEDNPRLGEGEITALARGGERLFVGTPNGLWERGEEGEWSQTAALVNRHIGVLLFEKDGTLWAGTDRGLSRFSGEGWRHFDEAGGFLGRHVSAVARDSAGRLWTGSEAGLGLFDGTYWSAYSETDGLHANAVTAILVRGEELLLGTGEGVSVFRPDRAPPDTRIIDPPREVVGTSSRLFEFSGSDFESGAAEMRYSWSLDDGPWSAFSGQARVTVEDLANGAHTFRVRSMDKGLNIDPTPAAAVFQVDTGLFDVEFVEGKISDLYAALYQVYASGRAAGADPVASVTVRNRYDRALRVKFSLLIAGLMDFPSDTVALLEPGETISVPLRIEMNDAVLALESTVTRQALLTMQYSLRGEMKESSHSLPVTIIERRSMSWQDPMRIGLYITHLDEDVERFARQVVRSFREAEKETIIYDNLLRAIELYDALGAHGVRYVADPENPYGGLTAETAILDVIRFPRETLASRTGDCDDVSVLYAALLQNIGIDTALVDVRDHVFVMFDTGLRRGQEGQLSRDGSLLHEDSQGKLWIPVETTLVGGTFTDAWRKGAEALRERQYTLIETSRAWSRYAPLQLPGPSRGVTVPSREAVMPLFSQDLALQRDNLVSEAAGGLLDRIAADPGDADARNALGILLARNGYLRQAEAQFREITTLAPDSAAGYGNLANVLYELERYEEAVENYVKSLEIENGLPEVHVELALTYCEIGRFDLARGHYEEAIRLGATDHWAMGVSKLDKKE